MAATKVSSFDTAHGGGVHDAQLDYYGKRIATASADHTVRIFDVASETPSFQSELKGHDGPVWQVAWAHPKYGNVLASCGNDRRVLIWREQAAQQAGGYHNQRNPQQQQQQQIDWQIVYRIDDFPACVNAVSWAPWEYGLHVACACGDGSIAVISHGQDGQWSRSDFPAHSNGANAVSWAPAATPAVMATGGGGSGGGTNSPGIGPMRLVTGGSDNQVKVWIYDTTTSKWIEKPLQNGGQDCHADIVRDVSWRPSVGTPGSLIASCSEDGSVILWVQDTDAGEGRGFTKSQVLELGAPVWRCAWSVTGSVLACASGDCSVTLFKEALEGTWEKQTQLDESAHPPSTPQNENDQQQGQANGQSHIPQQGGLSPAPGAINTSHSPHQSPPPHIGAPNGAHQQQYPSPQQQQPPNHQQQPQQYDNNAQYGQHAQQPPPHQQQYSSHQSAASTPHQGSHGGYQQHSPQAPSNPMHPMGGAPQPFSSQQHHPQQQQHQQPPYGGQQQQQHDYNAPQQQQQYNQGGYNSTASPQGGPPPPQQYQPHQQPPPQGNQQQWGGPPQGPPRPY